MEKKYLSGDEIIGKQVVDSNAIIVGKVKNVAIDITSKNIALTVTTKKSGEIHIERSSVTIIGDVVLLNKPIQALISPPTEEAPTPSKVEERPVKPATTPGLCNSCGYQNDADSKFCIKCGTNLK